MELDARYDASGNWQKVRLASVTIKFHPVTRACLAMDLSVKFAWLVLSLPVDMSYLLSSTPQLGDLQRLKPCIIIHNLLSATDSQYSEQLGINADPDLQTQSNKRITKWLGRVQDMANNTGHSTRSERSPAAQHIRRSVTPGFLSIPSTTITAKLRVFSFFSDIHHTALAQPAPI
jgi:hypothetical protein